MDRRERSGNPMVAIQAMLEGWQAGIWTALPCVVVSAPEIAGAVPFSPAKRTVTLRSLIQVRVQQPTGDFIWVTPPPLVDVPVFFPGGGGCTITFPIKEGNIGVVVFASRCIDAWWQHGGSQPQVQMEFRMHDMSDGFFFPTLNALPDVIPAISTASAQFRSDTGHTYVEVDPGDGFIRAITPGEIDATAGGKIVANAGGDIEATSGANIVATAAGDMTLTAGGNLNLNGTLIINGHPYLSHEHTGVLSGGSNTGGVHDP